MSFLYLDLYVLGDDALISKGSFMQTKHLCVFVHILTMGEVGEPLNRCKPSSKYFADHFKAVLLLWIFYVFSILCLRCLCMCLVVTCWERADLLALVCGV